MGNLARAIVALTVVAAAAPASAQAGRELGAPTGPAPTTDPAAPPATGYVPPPPAYGGPQLTVEQPRAPRRRATGDRTQKHVGTALAVIGGAVFANAYLPMALAWSVAGPDWMVVPVIGPFAMIAEDPLYDQAIFWVAGVLQVAGALAMAVGLGLRFSFDDTPASEAALVPWLGPEGGGLGLTGRF